MSILKGTGSGVYKKLTPSYIVSFGWVTDINHPYTNVFSKQNEFITWNKEEKKFVFSFTYINDQKIRKKFEYHFDTYYELKLLEIYLFDTEPKKSLAFEQIRSISREIHDLFGEAQSVFAKTISSNIVSVQPLSSKSPVGTLYYMDF